MFIDVQCSIQVSRLTWLQLLLTFLRNAWTQKFCTWALTKKILDQIYVQRSSNFKLVETCGFLQGFQVFALNQSVSNKQLIVFHYPYAPWDWYIYLHLPQIYAIDVDKYTKPMEWYGLCFLIGWII